MGDTMFGYIIINKAEMKFKEFDVYQSFYCGLCKTLKSKYGNSSQMTLNYDLTFLVILLTGLYEPDTIRGTRRCIARPLEKMPTRINEFSEYAADMSILMSYYKCKDDWVDEKKVTKLLAAQILKPKCKKMQKKYPDKVEKVSRLMAEITLGEANGEADIDAMSGRFGEMMGELFVFKEDEWSYPLHRLGFFLGKFIYLMDAYEDIEEDIKNGNYNPFTNIYNTPEFEKQCKGILTMMIAECSKEFEKLPILEHVDILRNILYSGVWGRYEMIKAKREEGKVEKHD